VSGWKGVNEIVGVAVEVGVGVSVDVGVMVPVTISGVRLRVEGGMPVVTIVRVMVGVGVIRVFGARARAIKPTQ